MPKIEKSEQQWRQELTPDQLNPVTALLYFGADSRVLQAF